LREQYEGDGGDVDVLDEPFEDLEDEFDEQYHDIQNMNDKEDNIYTRIRREFETQKEVILRKKYEERAETKRLAKLERVQARVHKLKQKSQKLMYGEIKDDPNHAEDQIDNLQYKLGRPLSVNNEKQMLNDKGLNEKTEELEEVEEEFYDEEEQRNRQNSIYEYEEEGEEEEPLRRRFTNRRLNT